MKLRRREGLAPAAPLFDVEGAFIGVCRLLPGEAFANHFHTSHEETFVVVEGGAELWTGRAALTVLVAGDLAVCVRGEDHYLRNHTDAPFTAYFIKTPNLPQDRVDVPWAPPSLE